MSSKVIQIATAFMNLNDSEKAEFLEFFRLGQGGLNRGGRISNEEFGKSETINFAPGPRVCPRCGK